MRSGGNEITCQFLPRRNLPLDFAPRCFFRSPVLLETHVKLLKLNRQFLDNLGLADRRDIQCRKVLADEAYLTRSIMQPLEEVVAGFKPTMPSYQGKLGGPETAALLEYIKSLRTRPPGTLGRIAP